MHCLYECVKVVNEWWLNNADCDSGTGSEVTTPKAAITATIILKTVCGLTADDSTEKLM